MIKLNNALTFIIERYDKRARLIIHKQDNELVCRKTTFSEIEKLFKTDGIHLFKGRLQLYRSGNDIAVEVKGKVEGNISLATFTKYYNAVKEN